MADPDGGFGASVGPEDRHAPNKHSAPITTVRSHLLLTACPFPTYHEVQPILMERCAPCHVGEQLNDCPSTCFSSFYESLPGRFTCCAPPFTLYEEPPDDCQNLAVAMTIGECSLERVLHFEEDGKDAVPPDQVLILKTWVEHGMPE